jgi:hypothetical protein
MQQIAGENHGKPRVKTCDIFHEVPLRIAAILVLVVALAVGCSREQDHHVPAACKSGVDALRAALQRAPGEVRLEGTLLSSCFVRSSEPGDVQAVGATYVEVASELAAKARTQPQGVAATRLGYLVGATRRGAARTQGIHDELVRRIDQELLSVDTGSSAFHRGERAGRSSG